MKQLVLHKEDGSKEVVYVEEEKKQQILFHAQSAYFLIGTIALALSIVLTWKTLKNGSNG